MCELLVSEQAPLSGKHAAQNHGCIRIGEHHQFVWITGGQEFEESSVHDAENCRVCADGNRQDTDCKNGRPRVLSQHSEGETDIVWQASYTSGEIFSRTLFICCSYAPVPAFWIIPVCCRHCGV